MSHYYAKNNDETIEDLFYKRAFYRKEMQNLNENNIVDFYLGEKMFYGRMDRQERAVFLKTEGHKVLTNVGDSRGGIVPKGVVNFVATNFQLLKNDISKAAKTGKIYSQDKYLTDLKVYRAFESVEKKYAEYRGIYISQLGELLRTQNFLYTNLEEFMPLMMEIFENTLNASPLTLPAFIKSNLNDIMSTGLAIEIADLKYSNDEEKVDFINGPNWQYFVNACDTYGFMIDATCPWRIVADINSDIMVEASRRLNSASGESIFYLLYEQAFAETMGELHSLIAAIYTAGRRKRFFVEEFCDGKVVRKEKRSKPVSFATVLAEFAPADLLKIYMIIRSYETGIQLSPNEMEQLIENTLEANSSSSSNKRYVAIFESILSKTFDKKGSFSYYRSVFAKLKQKSLKDEESLVIINDYGGGY